MTAESLKPRFLLLQGDQVVSVREIEPGQDWKIGRHPQCPVVVQHPSVSRFHARILCDASGVRIEDLSTANGTYVNNKKVEGAVPLRSGDLIRLGQLKNPEPILVKFEDPSSQLLDALAEQHSDPGIIPRQAPPAPAPPRTVGDEGPTVTDEGDRAALAQAAQAAAVQQKKPSGVSSLFRLIAQPVVWIPVGGVLMIALAIGLWLVIGGQTTQRPWQSVRVEPVNIRAGWRVALRGPDIVPSDDIKVWVQSREAKVEGMTHGEIHFLAPDLGGDGESGTSTVTLQVDRNGIVLFRQALQYEVVPEVKAVNPPEAAVGGTVSVQGTGFVREVSRVQAKIGQMQAQVLSANPREIQLRVPVLTRSGVVEVPLEVKIGDWTAPIVSLRVRPRDTQCYPLAFTAGYAAEKVWEVRHVLGVATYAEGAPPAGEAGASPGSVKTAMQNLTTAFEKAAKDPTVSFEIRDGMPLTVVATGSSLPRSLEVARWTNTVLTMVKARSRFEGDATFIPYWNVMVLNDMLNVFGKAQTPSLLPADSTLRSVLQKLYDRSVEAGGTGCPGPDEVQTLTPAERDQFQQACWNIPRDFGSVAGTWEGVLANFSPTDAAEDVKRVLRLHIRQRGMALSGSASVEEVRPEGIRWSPPAIPTISGRMILGSQARIEINFPHNQPFRVTRLTGSLQGDAIEGTYSTEAGTRGNCRLTRTVAE